MLVLSRKDGQGVKVNDDITVRVVAIKGSTVRLGFDAPPHVKLLRDELVVPLEEPETDDGDVSRNHAPTAA